MQGHTIHPEQQSRIHRLQNILVPLNVRGASRPDGFAGLHRTGTQQYLNLILHYLSTPNPSTPTTHMMAKSVIKSTITRVELEGPVPTSRITLVVEIRQEGTRAAKVLVSGRFESSFLSC